MFPDLWKHVRNSKDYTRVYASSHAMGLKWDLWSCSQKHKVLNKVISLWLTFVDWPKSQHTACLLSVPSLLRLWLPAPGQLSQLLGGCYFSGCFPVKPNYRSTRGNGKITFLRRKTAGHVWIISCSLATLWKI